MKTRDTFGDYNYWELFNINNLKPRKTTTTKMKETEQVTTLRNSKTTELMITGKGIVSTTEKSIVPTKESIVKSSTEKQTTEKIKDEDPYSMNNFTITMSVSFEEIPKTCDCKILK